MATRKKAGKKRSAGLQKDEVSSTTLDSSSISLNSTMNTAQMPPNRITKAFVEQKLKDKIDELEDIERRTLADIELIHSEIGQMLTPEQLNTPISLDKLEDLLAIMNGSIWNIIQNKKPMEMTPANNSGVVADSSTTKRPSRRSSFSENRLSVIEEQESPRPRSASVGGRTPYISHKTPMSATALKTPMNRIPNRVLMTSKFTVRKPVGSAAVPNMPIKRVMRAGEEAISTCGSPLFVQGRVPNEPEVNIPLSNGVILNIDPNNPDQRMAVPQFDEATANKIRILCRKLQDCIA